MPLPNEKPVPSVLASIDMLRNRSSELGGLYASTDKIFKNKIFGRDEAQCALDLLYILHESGASYKMQHKEIVEEIIHNLIFLQGTKEDGEEEIGRIHHECNIEENNEVTNLRYDAIDPTPLFIKVIYAYTQRFGKRILGESIRTKDKTQDGDYITISVEDSLANAVKWVERRIQMSPNNLFSYKHKEMGDIENQYWTDSYTAIIDRDGKIPDFIDPIAVIGAQGLAYDALLIGSKLLGNKRRVGSNPSFLKTANDLQESVMREFWMPDEKYFAQAVIEKNTGVYVFKTHSASAAEILNTSILDSLPLDMKQQYIEGVIRNICSSGFLTDIGIRCRGLNEAPIISFHDYHGSLVTWFKQSFDIAKGFERQGFIELANQLYARILNGMNFAGNFYEFLYVDPFGDSAYGPYEQVPSDSELSSITDNDKTIVGTNFPEQMQAWSVFAALVIKYKNGKRRNGVTNETSVRWIYDLEKEIIREIPNIVSIKRRRELVTNLYGYRYFIDITKGREEDNKYR